MKVLVVGGGGREHALAWKLAQSPQVTKVICQSGNAGIESVAQCTGEPAGGIKEMAAWSKAEGIDLTVVGPEAYLDLGIVDTFAEHGLAVVGPTQKAAAIESSKVFAKELMARHNIPTAGFSICDTAREARRAIRTMGAPVVVKAEGLAGGKGVTVARSIAEAEAAVARIMEEKEFGEAGERVVVEEFMEGEEASVLAFVDGRHILPMVPAQDHKAIGEGDTGPNTGGMGAYSPAPVVTPAVARRINGEILEPVVSAMAAEGAEYRGILYAGLMITESGPKVVEFNCRFGDPEAQAVLPRLKSDLVEPLMATVEGRLDEVELQWEPQACICVVLASAGYPGKYETGLPIEGLSEAAEDGVLLFHSGTRREDDRILTDGGRVLGVTALGTSLSAAKDRAYRAAEKIRFKGRYFRGDIGAKALARE